MVKEGGRQRTPEPIWLTMKGKPVPLRVPRRGQQRNVVPHLTGANSVVDGQNMVVTLDGRYGVRPGYEQYGDDSLTEPPWGGLFFRDVNLAPQFVVAGATKWFKYTSGTETWADITPAGDPLTGVSGEPVRFTTYFQSNAVWVLGANNANPIKRWEPTLAEYSEIAASPICRDVTVVANRVLAVNTLESGVRHATRVRWSSEADATSWPALAFFDLSNAGEPIVAIKPLSRTTAAVYRTESLWVVQAQAGGDATAFLPEQVSTGVAGPAGASSIVAVDRVHYYIGRDNKVYRFDGVRPTVISTAITKLLDDTIDPEYWSSIHGTYFARRREIWWWVTKNGESTPKTAFVYDIDEDRWEVEQRFSVGVTFSAQAEDSRANTWDSLTVTWDELTATWDSLQTGSRLVMLLGTDDNRVLFFGEHINDDGADISFSWTMPVLYAGEERLLLPDEVESFFKTVSPASGETAPTITLSVYGLQQPIADRELLYSDSLDLTSTARLRSKSGDTVGFDSSNYRPGLQIEYSGSTPNREQVEWGGGTLLIYDQVDG